MSKKYNSIDLIVPFFVYKLKSNIKYLPGDENFYSFCKKFEYRFNYKKQIKELTLVTYIYNPK